MGTGVNKVVVLSAARSAIGTFGGSLSKMDPPELAGIVMKAAVERSGVEAENIKYVTVGNVVPTDGRSAYVSRVASIQAGLGMDSVAMNVNRLCGSGLQAVVSSAQNIQLGDYDYAIGGGVEVMSRAAYINQNIRFGIRMGDTPMVDGLLATLQDPFGAGHMGVTAENLAEKWNISREEQDAFALESQRRAAAAIEAGYFKEQIVPITLKSRKGEVVFDTDEHVKPNTSMEELAKLKPAFKEGGTVTAGNASGLNDGASFLVLASASAAEKNGHKPIARVVGYSVGGVPNHLMGEGPIPSTQQVMQKTGLSLDQMDVIESNEAFAAQSLAVAKGLEFDPMRANPNGGAIAIGHPVGASGAYLTTKALYELQRIEGKYALVTMCIGGGQGIAVIYERI